MKNNLSYTYIEMFVVEQLYTVEVFASADLFNLLRVYWKHMAEDSNIIEEKTTATLMCEF